MQPQQNTLATEIILGIVAGPMAIAAPVLLYLGTINLGGALTIWGIAAGLVVGKLALNAPSSIQQQQLGTLQAQQNAQNVNLQQLVQYALSVLPGLVQPQAPVAPPQPQQAAPLVASGQIAHMLATPPEVTLTPAPANASEVEVYRLAGTPPMQTQFKSITIPDVSAPMAAVGQGIPLGQ